MNSCQHLSMSKWLTGSKIHRTMLKLDFRLVCQSFQHRILDTIFYYFCKKMDSRLHNEHQIIFFPHRAITSHEFSSCLSHALFLAADKHICVCLHRKVFRLCVYLSAQWDFFLQFVLLQIGKAVAWAELLLNQMYSCPCKLTEALWVLFVRVGW